MSKLETNTIDTISGSTTLTLGGTNATTIAQDSATTVTGFKSTGIDDNASSTAVTIDSSGNVGIGETSMDGLLVIKGDSDENTTPSIRLKDGSDTREAWITNTAGDLYITTGGDDNTPHTQLRMFNSSLMTFRTNNQEDMRISGGDVMIGTTTTYDAARLTVNASSGSYVPLTVRVGLVSNGFTGVFFKNPNGTVGSIAVNSSSTSYNTSSDYRLKENLADITDATDRVKQLQPKRFNFITDADTTVDGFVAHEVSSIVPEAVSGEKDAVNEDGSIKPQGIDQSKLVPVLTKALQEAITKIEELETRIQTLENA